MPQPSLSQSKRDEILKLKALGYLGHAEIARKVGCSNGSVSNVVRSSVDPLIRDEPKKADSIEEFKKYHREKFLELQERFNTWLGDTGKVRATKDVKHRKRIKAAVGNDIHAPYHKEAAVGRFVSDNRDADEAWIPGDLLDLLAFSHYPKTRMKFTPVEEFQSGRVLIRSLSENFPKVKILSGNHDDRFIKYLVRLNIPPDILEFFRLMCPEFDSPLAKICAQFPNVEVVKPAELDYAKFPFIHQIGDCVLSHAEKFSRIPNRAVGDVHSLAKVLRRAAGTRQAFQGSDSGTHPPSRERPTTITE
jgi:hypothetical protein